MSRPIEPSPFIFSPSIDSSHLYSLYENDYQWIEEIFRTALSHFNEDVQAVRDHFLANDLTGLKRAIHKIKPTFGFVGMPQVQDLCKTVEDRTAVASGTHEISTDIENFLRVCTECRLTLETDTNRLEQFNQTT